MKTVTEGIQEYEAVLKKWDDGLLSAADCLGHLNALALDPFLETLEAGQEYMVYGSCCCSGHPPNRTFKVQFTIEPHGFSAKRCE